MKNILSLVVLCFIVSGCVSVPRKAVSFEDGDLEFELNGCKIINPTFQNKSSDSIGTVFHRVLALDGDNNTVGNFSVNCHPTVSGGKSNCIARAESLSGAGSFCGNFKKLRVFRE